MTDFDGAWAQKWAQSIPAPYPAHIRSAIVDSPGLSVQRIAWDKPALQRRLPILASPWKEGPAKYFCENELPRPLPEAPNSKTEEQQEAGPEAAEQEAWEQGSASRTGRHSELRGSIGCFPSSGIHSDRCVHYLGDRLLGA